MRCLLPVALFAALSAPGPAHAELREVRQRIAGME